MQISISCAMGFIIGDCLKSDDMAGGHKTSDSFCSGVETYKKMLKFFVNACNMVVRFPNPLALSKSK